MSYICLHCGHQFDRPKSGHEGGYPEEPTDECPNCGSLDIEEAEKCEICGEVHRDEDMIGRICKDCLTKSVTLHNALRLGAECKDAVELNGFLTWCFSADEIESILLKNLQEQSPEWRKRMYKDYCEDDPSLFADFLYEKGADA